MKIDVLNKWSSPTDQAALDFLRAAVADRVTLEDRKFSGDLGNAIDFHRRTHGTPLLAKMHGQDLGLRPDANDLSAMLPSSFVAGLPLPIRSLMAHRDGLVGIPVGLHRANSLFANRRLLERFGIALPQTLEECLAATRRLAEAGIQPFAVAPDPMLLGFLFETLAVASAGARYHRAAFADTEDEALRCTTTLGIVELWLDLLRSSPVEDRPWRELGTQVKHGDAAFFACGDFASPFMLDDAERTGVVEIAFPGTAVAFVFIADFFTPIGFAGDDELAALTAITGRWTDPETSRDFCRRKGALPPVERLTGEDASPDVLAKQDGLHDAVADGTFVPSMTLEQATPHRVRAAILGVLSAHARSDATARAMQAALAEAVGAAWKATR